jgi:hypothetical protein
MLKRLLELKAPVNEILADLKIDSLLVAERTRVAELVELLEPFSTQTNILQTDALSLSYAVPSILDLECHLQSFQHSKVIAKSMLADMHSRFKNLLDPRSPDFIPHPAASCLLDPTVASVLLTPDMACLLTAAKEFIISEVSFF